MSDSERTTRPSDDQLAKITERKLQELEQERRELSARSAGSTPGSAPVTPSIPTLQPSDAPMGEPGRNEEERLDEALQETMTTSDPVSIKIA